VIYYAYLRRERWRWHHHARDEFHRHAQNGGDIFKFNKNKHANNCGDMVSNIRKPISKLQLSMGTKNTKELTCRVESAPARCTSLKPAPLPAQCSLCSSSIAGASGFGKSRLEVHNTQCVSIYQGE
jgi:hypothetical protein